MSTRHEGHPREPVSGTRLGRDVPAGLGAPRDPAWRGAMWLILLALLGLVVLAAFWLVIARTRAATAIVARRHIIQWESARGQVVAPANKLAVINCRCSAPVSRVFTSVGATVRRGDILVEVAHPTARAARDAAQSELATARRSHEQARRIALAEVRVVEQRVARAQRSLQLAQAENRARVEIPTGMQTVEGAAPEEPPEPPLPLEVAQAELEQARLDLTNARDRMTEIMTPHRQRLEAAQVTFEEAQAGLKAAFVRSPIAGQVIELNARPGQDIRNVPNMVVAVVADLSSLKVHADLTDEQYERINPGMAVQLQLAHLPHETFEGRVESVQVRRGDVVTDEEREISHVAIISFFNRQGLVKPDMVGQALIKVAARQNAISVPVGAVHRDENDQPYVRLYAGGKWIKQTVQIGPSDGEYIAVMSGLRDGQAVRVDQTRAEDSEN